MLRDLPLALFILAIASPVAAHGAGQAQGSSAPALLGRAGGWRSP